MNDATANKPKELTKATTKSGAKKARSKRAEKKANQMGVTEKNALPRK